MAIAGMPDDRWGEAPHAFVVLEAAGHFQTVTNSDLRLQTPDSEHEHEQEQERCIHASSFIGPLLQKT
jgi:acyl-CoA synthetase (AMP-forming)/AMP-acid ligase II